MWYAPVAIAWLRTPRDRDISSRREVSWVGCAKAKKAKAKKKKK